MLKREIFYDDFGKPLEGDSTYNIVDNKRKVGVFKEGYKVGVHRMYELKETKDGSFKDILCLEKYYEGEGFNSYLQESISYNEEGKIICNVYNVPFFNDNGMLITTRPQEMYFNDEVHGNTHQYYSYVDNISKVEETYTKNNYKREEKNTQVYSTTYNGLNEDLLHTIHNVSHYNEDTELLTTYSKYDVKTLNTVDCSLNVKYLSTKDLMGEIHASAKPSVYEVLVMDLSQTVITKRYISVDEAKMIIFNVEKLFSNYIDNECDSLEYETKVRDLLLGVK